ncbi:MAG: iron-sulfur cluster assembly protein [Bacteroidales bacterium]|nr:iron-sulfur cluster assembly protein [Bacteroidales bacterium]
MSEKQDSIKKEQLINALKTVHDPEIPLNIYDLGLIYGIDIQEDHRVQITMTLTNANCPVADDLVRRVQQVIQEVPGVASVELELVFDPPWTKEKMSDAAMLELGLL